MWAASRVSSRSMTTAHQVTVENLPGDARQIADHRIGHRVERDAPASRHVQLARAGQCCETIGYDLQTALEVLHAHLAGRGQASSRRILIGCASAPKNRASSSAVRRTVPSSHLSMRVLVQRPRPAQRILDVRADVLSGHVAVKARARHQLRRLLAGAAQDQCRPDACSASARSSRACRPVASMAVMLRSRRITTAAVRSIVVERSAAACRWRRTGTVRECGRWCTYCGMVLSCRMCTRPSST